MKSRLPKGVKDLHDPLMEPGEAVMAANFADNRTSMEGIAAVIGGSMGVRMARRASGPPAGGNRPDDSTLAGLAPKGELLIAVTDRRLLLFPRKGPQVFTPFVMFAPHQFGRVTFMDQVIGAQELNVDFVDGSRLVMALTATNFGSLIVQRSLEIHQRFGFPPMPWPPGGHRPDPQPIPPVEEPLTPPPW